MIYLLDVKALVALGFINHEFHDRLAAWLQSRNSPKLASCSITELGFVRVLAQAPAYGFTVTQARTLLLRLKQARTSPLAFIPDEHDVSHLPAWVRAPKQITDGHLSKLATANSAVLATLDESIPGSYRIPK
jgi:predicted nucleic acid-binding protein